MMYILCYVTFSGTTYKVKPPLPAVSGLASRWLPYVTSIDPIRMSVASELGGIVTIQAGGIGIDNALFAGEVPPSVGTVSIKLTNTTEVEAIEIISGNLAIDQIGIKDTRYGIYDVEYSDTLGSTLNVNDTLSGVIEDLCGASYLNVTYNDDDARSPSPDVYSGAIGYNSHIVNVINDLCLATNHFAEIIDGTLYLCDMMAARGTELEIDFSDIENKPVPCRYNQPYKRFASSATKEYSIDGSNKYGRTYSSPCAQLVENFYLDVIFDAWPYLTLTHKEKIQFYQDRYYRMTVAYKGESDGDFDNQVGFACYADDETTVVDKNGGIAPQLIHSFCLNTGTVDTGSGWKVATGYVYGTDTTGDSDEHPSIADPAVLHEDTGFFSPSINLFDVGCSLCDLSFERVTIHEVDSADNEIEELFFYDFSSVEQSAKNEQGRVTGTVRDQAKMLSIVRGNSIYPTKGSIIVGDWIRRYGANPGFGEISISSEDSVAESKTNIEAHLANVKSIIESPAMSIMIPIDIDNIPQFGQKISWEDTDKIPGKTLSCWIRARSIIYDLLKQAITVGGEGSVS